MSEQNKIHILVVDDSVTIRRTIVNHLGDNYVTHEAADGEQAWQLLQSNADISLVFADMHMPVMNGMLLLKQIRSSECERIASLPVIIITGYENADAAKRASHNIGATDFIGKPFDAFDILDKVASYTRMDRKVLKKKGNDTHDKLTGLLNEISYKEHGEHALEYSGGSEMDTSLLSMHIVGLSDVFKEHGETTTKQIIITIANQLDDSLRGGEKAAHLGSGKFSVVLPETNEFKANIVAIRLQKQVSKLIFEKGDAVIRIKMAIGISSTDGSLKELTFDELRQQAEHALQMSLEQPATPIVRFDETYEKRCLEQAEEIDVDHKKQEKDVLTSDVDITEMNKYFSQIMSGDFDKVPAYYVESMVAPLQKFLDYAYTYTDIEQPVSLAKRKA